MSQYILINRINVQNANAIAGVTWGFPSVTHFLGFVHNLSRKLANSQNFHEINLSGCMVIAHNHTTHTYHAGGSKLFTQSRNPPHLQSHHKSETPPVIEEGKMNLTVSLLVKYDGVIGNRYIEFCKWLTNVCLVQRLAGGTILSIDDMELVFIDNDDDRNIELRKLKRKLLPGFILKDRSDYLKKHHEALQNENNDVDLVKAWLDFSALKRIARPKTSLISDYLTKLLDNDDELNDNELNDDWLAHLEKPYCKDDIPELLIKHFDELDICKQYKKLKLQWDDYCNPNPKTNADWEYVKKPENGYLVPIMVGYKAISKQYDKDEVDEIRINRHDDTVSKVCFVESAHSIGEWLSVHRLSVSAFGNYEKLEDCIWSYNYEENWYLCTQTSNHVLENEIESATPVYY